MFYVVTTRWWWYNKYKLILKPDSKYQDYQSDSLILDHEKVAINPWYNIDVTNLKEGSPSCQNWIWHQQINQ